MRKLLVAAILLGSFGLGVAANTIYDSPTVAVMDGDPRFDCLLGMGLKGNPTDHREALYPTQYQLNECSE